MGNAVSKLPDILRYLFGAKKVNLAKMKKRARKLAS